MSRNIKKARQLSRNNKDEIIAQEISVERSGILPIPNELEAYEKICPGVTKILLEEFQKQSTHRMGLEDTVIKSGVENSKRGQIFAFILALVALILGFILLILDKNVAGLTSILASLITPIGIFIYGNISKKDERIKKSKDNP